jgi:hypothetical protein
VIEDHVIEQGELTLVTVTTCCDSKSGIPGVFSLPNSLWGYAKGKNCAYFIFRTRYHRKHYVRYKVETFSLDRLIIALISDRE